MADTKRSLSDLQTLLADNTAGAISPQDLRDFLVSALGCYGEIYIQDGSTSQTAVTATPTILTGFASDGADGLGSGVTAGQALNKLTATIAGVYEINLAVSCQPESGAVWKFGIAVDAAESRTIIQLEDGIDTGAGRLLVALTANQDITVLVESDQGGGAAITVTQASLTARLIG